MDASFILSTYPIDIAFYANNDTGFSLNVFYTFFHFENNNGPLDCIIILVNYGYRDRATDGRDVRFFRIIIVEYDNHSINVEFDVYNFISPSWDNLGFVAFSGAF